MDLCAKNCLLFVGAYLIVTGAMNTRITFTFVNILFAIQTDDTRNANTFIAAKWNTF